MNLPAAVATTTFIFGWQERFFILHLSHGRECVGSTFRVTKQEVRGGVGVVILYSRVVQPTLQLINNYHSLVLLFYIANYDYSYPNYCTVLDWRQLATLCLVTKDKSDLLSLKECLLKENWDAHHGKIETCDHQSWSLEHVFNFLHTWCPKTTQPASVASKWVNFDWTPLFQLQIIQQTYLQSLQTQANGVFVGRGSFWQIWEKGGRMIPNYKVLWATIVLWENRFNYFGSCLQDGLYCSP